MKVLLNNNLLETPLPLEPVNRAFQYGDGVFETMWYSSGKVMLLDYHLERLRQGMELLQIKSHPGRFKFLADNIDSLRQFNLPDSEDCVVKLMVWRHASDVPGYLPTSDTAESLITIRPRTWSEEPVTLGISMNSVVTSSPWSTAKTLNSLPYVMAAHECRETEADDLVILNSSGEVAEAISANIFVLTGDVWRTPLLSSGCVSGVMRRFILDNTWEYKCEERTLHPDIFQDATAIVLTGATGCRAVKNINGRDLDSEKAMAWIREIHAAVMGIA